MRPGLRDPECIVCSPEAHKDCDCKTVCEFHEEGIVLAYD